MVSLFITENTGPDGREYLRSRSRTLIPSAFAADTPLGFSASSLRWSSSLVRPILIPIIPDSGMHYLFNTSDSFDGHASSPFHPHSTPSMSGCEFPSFIIQLISSMSVYCVHRNLCVSNTTIVHCVGYMSAP